MLGEAPAPSAQDFDADDAEDSIYEVMKQKLIEQRQELETRNAQMRQQGQSGRPAARPPSTYGRPATGPAAQGPAAPVFEKVTDFTNLINVWMAARKHLIATGSKYIETTLGHDGKLESLSLVTWDASVWIPPHHSAWANEKARVKIEESLRAVTGKGVHVAFHCPDPVAGQGSEGARFAPPPPNSAGGAGQRVAPEVVDAVKNQPLVRELMKRLDASVVHIEVADSGE